MDCTLTAVPHSSGMSWSLRPVVHPAAKHGADYAPKLIVGVLRERCAQLFLHLLGEGGGDLFPVFGRQVRIQVQVFVVLVIGENVFEVIVLYAQNHVAVHLDEPAVAVISEALVATGLGQAQHRLIVEAQIQDRVHHPRHRGPCAGAHTDQKRVFRIAELGADDLFDLGERGVDLVFQCVGIGLPVLGVVGADLGGDGKTRRHRQAKARHFGKVRALAAQQVAHIGAALGGAATKGINVFTQRSPPSI
jgi:hypothetical protein